MAAAASKLALSRSQEAADPLLQRPLMLVAVFAVFGAGYYLSYLFRTVNALLASRLTVDLSLGAAELGLLTSAYFLAAALAQIPVGIALDRFGPRRLQACSLLVAAVGALVFSISDTFWGLFAGRALIGLGVASALMAGLKAIVLWFPGDRVALLNGAFISIGAAGALTASAPIEVALAWWSWRELFLVLAFLTVVVAGLVAIVAPGHAPVSAAGSSSTAPSAGLRDILADRRFWTLAPLSALLIGTAWAQQGLWAAPWLREVAGLTQGEIVQHLFAMALALFAGALGFGVLADRMRRIGIGADVLLACTAIAFILSELSLALGWPVPPVVPWAIIGSVGAATVLSYTIMAQLFDKSVAGRANSTLNLLHFGAAFAVQTLIGLVVDQWPRAADGTHPPIAFATAFLALAGVQLLALLWFLRASSMSIVARGKTGVGWRGATRLAAAACAAILVMAAAQIHPPLSLDVFTVARSSIAKVPIVPGESMNDELRSLRESLATMRSNQALLATQIAARDSEIAALRGEVTTLTERSRDLDTRLAAALSEQKAVTAATAPASSADACPLAQGSGSELASLSYGRRQARLSREQLRSVDRAATVALQCREARIEIFVTSGRGETLSRRRAEAVGVLLSRRGIDRERIRIEVRATSAGLAHGAVPAGRSQHRPAVIAIRLAS